MQRIAEMKLLYKEFVKDITLVIFPLVALMYFLKYIILIFPNDIRSMFLFLIVAFFIFIIFNKDKINNVIFPEYNYSIYDCIIIGLPVASFLLYTFSNIGAISSILYETILFELVILGFWLCLRVVRVKERESNKYEDSGNQQSGIYYNALGEIEPERPIKDLLDRRDFANQIASLIIDHRSPSSIFGINGSWGSGKTFLMKMVFERLKDLNASFEKIEFESWHYREPNKIVFHFFSGIKNVLSKHCDSIKKINTILNDLANCVANVSISGVALNIDKLFKYSAYDERNELRSILEKEFNSRLIIFVDDLDRLDRDELLAVLRSIRQINYLPKITFVLAYDRSNLETILSFVNSSNTVATDYLGKLIQCEFNIAVPPETLRKTLLQSILAKCKNSIAEQESNQFDSFIEDRQLSYFLFLLLPNPREIKRILATTLWIYAACSEQESIRNYNIIDLFVLTIIQYRIPELYKRLQIQADMINSLLCECFNIHNNNELVVYGMNIELKKTDGEEATTGKWGEIFNKLLTGLSNEQYEFGKIFINYLLFPLFKHKYSIKHYDVYKERRLCCPDIFMTYFQYTYNSIQKNKNKLIKYIRVLVYSDVDHVAILDAIFQDSELRYLINDNPFWDIIKNQLIDLNNTNVFKYVILGMAKNSNLFPGNVLGNGISMPLFELGNKLLVLVFEYLKRNRNDNIVALQLINQIIDISTSFGFVTYVVNKIIKFKNSEIDMASNLSSNQVEDVYAQLKHKCGIYFENTNIFASSDDMFGLLTLMQPPLADNIKLKLLNELKENPILLFNILQFYIKFSFNEFEGASEVDDSLNKLNEKIHCKEILDAVENKIDILALTDIQSKQLAMLKDYVNKQE